MWGSIAVAVVYAVVPTCCILIGFVIMRRDYSTPDPTRDASAPHRQVAEGGTD